MVVKFNEFYFGNGTSLVTLGIRFSNGSIPLGSVRFCHTTDYSECAYNYEADIW